ncbi:MAG: 16S rRNA (uracil(1498)-N(3))-methyltransferase [Desulfuromonas sp.]|nr:MAG: 16S rRNA (uracil(1498)-N(3))-methyltransferase [Desulfuromonas sp.]
MARFFLDTDMLSGENVALPPDVVKHLQVLRLSVGSELTLLDGNGVVCRAILSTLGRGAATARILERRMEADSTLPLTLLFGLPKGEKIELVLQKGTELGITTFWPVYTERGDRRIPDERLAKRMLRWQRIVRDAAQQCRRDFLPQLMSPQPLSEALTQVKGVCRLVPWEEEVRSLAASLPQNPPASVAVLIGPEGGLTAEEVKLSESHRFARVSLGRRILRCETAGIAVAAILQYLYGDFGNFDCN